MKRECRCVGLLSVGGYFGFVVSIFPDEVPGTAVYLGPECQNLVFCTPKSCFKKLFFQAAVDWINTFQASKWWAGCCHQACQSHVKGKEKSDFLYNLLFNHIATLKLPAVLKFQSFDLNIPHGCRCHSNATLAKNNKNILINVWFSFHMQNIAEYFNAYCRSWSPSLDINCLFTCKFCGAALQGACQEPRRTSGLDFARLESIPDPDTRN